MLYSWYIIIYTVYYIPLSQPTSVVHWMRVHKAGGSFGKVQTSQFDVISEMGNETNFCKAV